MTGLPALLGRLSRLPRVGTLGLSFRGLCLVIYVSVVLTVVVSRLLSSASMRLLLRPGASLLSEAPFLPSVEIGDALSCAEGRSYSLARLELTREGPALAVALLRSVAEALRKC